MHLRQANMYHPVTSINGGDEFDGAKVDETKWSYWNWGQGGTIGRQNASADSSHIFQKDGVIHFVTTKKADGTVIRPVSITQTMGGNVPRKVKGAIKYGYIEMRMKAKLDDGSWPALWAQSSTNVKDRKEWNYFAEIDLMEACGNGGCGIGQNVSTKHKWQEGVYHSSSWGQIGKVSTDGADGSTWVVYGFLWTPDTMESYVNGKLYTKMSLKDAEAYDKNQTVGDKAKYAGMQGFRDPAYLILNGGVVSDSNTNFDKSKLPFDTQVDYVRVYQKPGEGDIYQQAILTTESLPSATVGKSYNVKLNSTGSPAKDNKFEITKDGLPSGLDLDAKTGVISGVPTASGQYTFTVTASNDQVVGVSNSRTYTIDVARDGDETNTITKPNDTSSTNKNNTNKQSKNNTKSYPGVPNTSIKLGSFGFLITSGILVVLLSWRKKQRSGK